MGRVCGYNHTTLWLQNGTRQLRLQSKGEEYQVKHELLHYVADVHVRHSFNVGKNEDLRGRVRTGDLEPADLCSMTTEVTTQTTTILHNAAHNCYLPSEMPWPHVVICLLHARCVGCRKWHPRR